MEQNYSVLMSVYYKEKPEYLRDSMDSIFHQTIPTNDFVLVCDGPLNEGLDTVISEMENLFGDILHIIRLTENSGLGNALNEGIKHCKNELIARMDSDDISKPERCEKQLAVFQKDPAIDICSGTVEEFEATLEVITGKRKLPSTNGEIQAFSRKRNPFNHPAVMFRKSAVKAAGGYRETYHFFEDYYLWVRMLQNGAKGLNLEETLLYMRAPHDMYLRRGGITYAKNMLHFHRWMNKNCNTSFVDYCIGAVPHAMVCMLPSKIRKAVYKFLH